MEPCDTLPKIRRGCRWTSAAARSRLGKQNPELHLSYWVAAQFSLDQVHCSLGKPCYREQISSALRATAHSLVEKHCKLTSQKRRNQVTQEYGGPRRCGSTGGLCAKLAWTGIKQD